MINSLNNFDIKFGIQSDAERYFWAAYFLLGVLSSLIGDTLILIASFQEGAFKVSKLIVTVIQHIAIADLGSSIMIFTPILISMLYNSWVLGDALCYVNAYASFFTYQAGLFFITLLTITKFLLLRHPLKISSISTKRAHLVCLSIWIFTMINPVVKLIVHKDDVRFDYRTYYCEYGYNAFSKTAKIILAIIHGVIPNFVIVATTIPTLQYLFTARQSARRVRSSDPWRGALTVVLTAVAYTISTLPFCVYHIAVNFADEDPSQPFPGHFRRICQSLLMINTVANFFIYSLTIPSFRKFLSSQVISILRVSRKRTKTGTTGT